MMNPDELKELAAVLTGIADRKPWQMRSSENVEWGLASDCADPMDVIKAGFQIRLKPWELGRIKCSELKSRFHDSEVGPKHNFSRTTRPIPFTLTKEQIADGWIPWAGGECPVEPESRPTVMFRNKETRDTKPAKDWVWHDSDGQWIIIAYRPDPYGHLRQALADGKTVQIVDSERNWVDLASPGFDAPPYRYLIKEPQRLPLGPSDVPPGSVVRKSDWPEGTWEVVHGTEVTGINWDEGNEKFDSIMEDWQINRPRHRDADGNPTLWEPCRKQAP